MKKNLTNTMKIQNKDIKLRWKINIEIRPNLKNQIGSGM